MMIILMAFATMAMSTLNIFIMNKILVESSKEAEQAEIKVVNHAYLIERLADYPETFWEIGCLSSMRLNNYFQSWKMLVRKV